jgi:hypothetical protein
MAGEPDPAVALKRTMQACPTCGRTVLTQVWRPGTGQLAGQWQPLWPPQEPVLGTPHDPTRCREGAEVATS